MSVDTATLAELIREAEAELTQVENRLRRAQEEAAELRQERDALRAVMERRQRSRPQTTQLPMTLPAAETVVLSDDDVIWARLPRTEAVERALEALWTPARAVGPTDVYEFLIKRGRTDKKEYIYAALSHLRTHGRAHRSGSGEWAPGPRPEDAEGSASAEPSVGATAIGQEGGVGTYAQAGSRDHGYPDQGQDRDHDRGASVAVGG